MMKYITRYIKERYVVRKIKKDLYEEFIKWCNDENINECLRKALEILKTCDCSNTNVINPYLRYYIWWHDTKYKSRYIKEHYVKRDIRKDLYNEFIEWCGERSFNNCLRKALEILKTNNHFSDHVKKDLDRERKTAGLYRFSK